MTRPNLKNAGKLLLWSAVSFSVSSVNADEIAAPTVYACGRPDGAFGQTGNFLVPQAALDEWVRLVVSQFPEYSFGEFINLNRWYCTAVLKPGDQGGVDAYLSELPSCSYRTSYGSVNLGSPSVVAGRLMCVRPGLHSTNTGSCGDGRPLFGNPVNIATGNKVLAELDYRAGFIELRRYYNSQGLITEKAVGPKWRHSFQRRLDPLSSSRILSIRANGSFIWFTNNGSQWIAAGDVNERLHDLGTTATERWKLEDSEAGEIEYYTANGLLSRVVTSSGKQSTLTYGSPRSSGAYPGPMVLVRVEDSLQRQISFRYDTHERVDEVSSLSGIAVRFTYDQQGNLQRATYADGSAKQFVYNESIRTSGAPLPHAVTSVVDEKGNTTAFYSYDTQGRATRTERAENSGSLTIEYQPMQTVLTDAFNSLRSFTFTNISDRIRLLTQSQPAGSGCGPSSSAITYDANANVTSRIDFNNHKVCYAYDLSRNLETKRVEGLDSADVCSAALSAPPTGARAITTEWHPGWRLATRTAEPKKITTSVYNGQGTTCAPVDALVDGRSIAVVCTRTEQATTDESGAAGFSATTTGTARTWRYTYTTYGRVLTAADPNNRVTTTSYHPDNDADLGKRGNVASITNAANHTTYLTDYNAHGQPTRIVDPNGVVTVLTYDPRMRLTSRTVGNEATAFGYDPVGQMTSVNLPDGARLTYTYDAAHRLTAINDHKGNRIAYTLDAMGNRTAEQMKDPGGVLVGNIARVIDALNRVQQVTGAGQ